MDMSAQEKLRYWVVIPAAGIGQRMQSKLPKQYIDLCGKTILEHTIDLYLFYPWVSKILLVLHPDDQYWPSLDCTQSEKIMTAIGGAERMHSVYQGLLALQNLAAPNDWVLVHDAVRPCLPRADLDRLLKSLRGHPVGGLLGCPVRDSLKKVNKEGYVSSSVSREHVWAAQTPQMFRFHLLQEALTRVVCKKQMVTDESGAVELLGESLLMVEGNPRNIKITYPEDLELAKYWLQEKVT